jgi:hypothetical protein
MTDYGHLLCSICQAMDAAAWSSDNCESSEADAESSKMDVIE